MTLATTRENVNFLTKLSLSLKIGQLNLRPFDNLFQF